MTSLSLQSLLVDQLLTPHLQTILDMPGSGLVSMLDADRTSDLRRMYTLFNRVPNDVGRSALRSSLRECIEERGKAINEGSSEEAGPSGAVDDNQQGMDEDDPKGKRKAKAVLPSSSANALSSALRWVQYVLDLKDKFDAIVDEAFSGDKSVQTSVNEVC